MVIYNNTNIVTTHTPDWIGVGLGGYARLWKKYFQFYKVIEQMHLVGGLERRGTIRTVRAFDANCSKQLGQLFQTDEPAQENNQHDV